MTKSLSITLLMVALTCLCFGQDDPAFDCQDPSACFSNVDFSFAMGALEQDSIEVPFWNDVIGISVEVNWAGGGTSYPGDLSLSLCSPSGACVTISGLDGALPGTSIGGWPTDWNSTSGGTYEACFNLSSNVLSGSGIWSLKGLNAYAYSAAGVEFTGFVRLYHECPLITGCSNAAACNYGEEEDCTYPGCVDEAACNYSPSAACDDGSCVFGPAPSLDVTAVDWLPFGGLPVNDLTEPMGVSCDGTSYSLTFPFWRFAPTGEFQLGASEDALAPGNQISGAFVEGGIWRMCGDSVFVEYTVDTVTIPTTDGSLNQYTGLSQVRLHLGLTETDLSIYQGPALSGFRFGADGAASLCYQAVSAQSGCTDVAACNYDAMAGSDDGSCTYPGCVDEAACNYSPSAACDDGSCVFGPAPSLDVTAVDWLPFGGLPVNDLTEPMGVSCDGTSYSLTFPFWRFAPTGEFQLGASEDALAPGNQISGAFVEGGIWRMCGDSVFVEYTVDTVTIPTTDGSLNQYTGLSQVRLHLGLTETDLAIYQGPALSGFRFGADGAASLCYQAVSAQSGCTDVAACNYDAMAGSDDGSCTYPGCVDEAACNYSPSAACDDGSCVFGPAPSLDVTAVDWLPFGGLPVNDLTEPMGVSCDGTSYSLTFPFWRFAPTGEFQLGASEDALAPGNQISGAFVEGGIWRMCGDSVFVEYTVDTVTIPTTDGSLNQYTGLSQVRLHLGLTETDLSIYQGPALSGFRFGADGAASLCYQAVSAQSGCTDVAACNYDAMAGSDDGSCTYPGCADEAACNYSPSAACDDGSCVFGPAPSLDVTAVDWLPFGGLPVNDLTEPMGVSCDGTSYSLTFPFWRFAPTGEFQLGASEDALAPGNQISGAFVEGGIWRMCGDSVFVEYTVDTVTIPTTDGSLNQYTGLSQVRLHLGLTETDLAIYQGPALSGFRFGADGAASLCYQAVSAQSGCTDVAACNYDAMAGSDDGSCTYPGCADEAACNYSPSAACDDGSCTFEQHVFIPNQESTFGSAVFVWCGPLPDCSNVTIGCPIPSGYVEIDDPCVHLILDDFAACSLEWSQTCSLQLLLCMQSDLGCTNPQACNFDAEASYDDGSCVFPGMPCEDGDPCTAGDELDLNCDCIGDLQDQDGDGLCASEDCDDENPALPDALGRCDIPVAGCSNQEAFNFTPEPAEETACLVPGGCGELLIAEEWAAGFTGWMSPEQWTLSHPELSAIDQRALVLYGVDAGEVDTVKAEITAPEHLTLQFTFGYHTADGSPVWDPPMVLVNGEVKPVMSYMTSTAEPGMPLVQPGNWLHNQTIMPGPDVAPDPALLPPEHLLPMGLIQDEAMEWDYPYQMPVGVTLDSGDVLSIALGTYDGLYGSASLAISAMSRERYCPGCTDEMACNFDSLITEDDGSCDYSCIGCMEEEACDFDPEATLPNDSCDYSCYGCMDTNACNYDASATRDSGCEYCSCGITPMVTATGGVNQEGVNTANATLLATDGGIAQCSLRDTTVILFGVEDGPFIEIDGVADHVLALSVDSLLYGYGRNNFGQATVPPNLSKPIAFSAGQTHSVAVDATGQVHGWGDGSSGQLNFGTPSSLAGIEAGVYHTLGWNSEGEIIMAVGSNDFGQLDVPEGLVVQKMSSSLHNIALTHDGQVVCWGYNEYGQCDVPSFDQPVIDIAASKRASLALLEDGSLVIWGRLKQIEPIEDAVAISGNISEDHFAILNQNGRIHHLAVAWFLSFQGPSGTALVEARPHCTDWCTDRDLDGVCDMRDDCIGTLGECGCECLNDENENGVCDELEVRGCMNQNALNYNGLASLQGPCRFRVHQNLPQADGMEDACNFDPDTISAWLSAYEGPAPLAPNEAPTFVEGLLDFTTCGGCMDPYGCNFNPEATWEDGTCDYSSCSGCLDPLACNFNPYVEATDSCDYCSCHWTEPLVDDNGLSILTLNSRGEAELRSNSTIDLPNRRYGETIEGVLRRNNVRSGSCGINSAILIMRDSSLEEMSNVDEALLIRLQYMEEFELEDRLGVDLHVRAIEAETTKPAGHDFVQVVGQGAASLALRADGTVEVWGSDALFFGDWAESAQGSNGLNLLEWTRSLENIVQLESSDVLQGALALDADGTLHAYSPRFVYEGIPDGFQQGTALMECGYLGRCVLIHEDGSHAYMFAEGDNVGQDSEILDVPNWAAGTVEALLDIGTPIKLAMSFVDMLYSAIYDNGDLAIVQGNNQGEANSITVLTAAEVPGVVDVGHGLTHAAVLNTSGELIRYDMDTVQNGMFPAYPVDPSNPVPDLEFYVDQFPRRMLLGPPTDCQGCPDSDGDGICDVVDDCEGEEDALGVCGGDCLGDFDHDGECDLLDRPGCTYVEACTYLEEATWDDGSCVFSMIPTDADFSGLGGGCPSDLDGNGTVATSDLLVLLTAFGEECALEEVDFFDPCFDEVPFDCGSPYSFHGVEYPTVEIGALCWFQTNLGSPHFANGQPVDVAESLVEWEAADGSMAAQPGWDAELVETYGLLYNALAISDPRGLCPWGWHVSTDAEWMDSEIASGMSLEEAVSLGNRGVSDNIASRFKDNSPLWGFAGGGNNLSGFTALPAGRIDHLGNNNSQGASAWFWAAPPLDEGERALRSLSSGNGGVFRDFDNSDQGFSVRCVKD